MEEISDFEGFDKFNNLLQQINIPQEAKEKLIKKYKKMLDEKNRVKDTDLKQIFSSNDINEEETEHLVNVYNRYLNNNIKNNNIKKKIDSLLFLSEMSSKRISKIKVQSCIKNKTLNFEKCRKFLKETERLKIVLPEKYEEFKKKNNIYFDDENHKDLPKRDVLYRRINENYFVNNDDYFEKCTDYYFTLYSNIFSLFDLKKINLSLRSNLEKIDETTLSANANVVSATHTSNKTNKKNKEKKVTMEFQKQKGKNDKYNHFNMCYSLEDELNFLDKELPQNLNKAIYDPTPILNLIKNRTKNMLSNFNQIINIENTDIEQVESTLQTKFKLTDAISLSRRRSTSSYINKRVNYELIFYNIIDDNSDEETDNEDVHSVSEDESNSEASDEEEESSIKPRKSKQVSRKRMDTINNSCRSRGVPPSATFKASKPYEKKDDEYLKEDELYKWISRKRYDLIPENAICTGMNQTDGKMYIGKINNIPAKVNLDKKKIWNYWAKDLPCNQCGEILITEHSVIWKSIQRGDTIPENAIKVGRDNHGDLVWVGKSNNNEPGKINCEDNDSETPTMHNFWCQGEFMSSKSAFILTIEKIEGEEY